jgi:hypothetical protein
MDELLGWPPILWTLRVFAITLLTGCTYVFVLLVARFLRPSHVRALITASLPRIQRIGGEFAGTKGEIEFALGQDARVIALEMRVDGLQESVEYLVRRVNSDGTDHGVHR